MNYSLFLLTVIAGFAQASYKAPDHVGIYYRHHSSFLDSYMQKSYTVKSDMIWFEDYKDSRIKYAVSPQQGLDILHQAEKYAQLLSKKQAYLPTTLEDKSIYAMQASLFKAFVELDDMRAVGQHDLQAVQLLRQMYHNLWRTKDTAFIQSAALLPTHNNTIQALSSLYKSIVSYSSKVVDSNGY